MSHDGKGEIRKEDLDRYLYELAKEFKKETGRRATAELILVGGGSILVNYNFRGITTDIDAIIRADASMKESINKVGDRNGLPNGWLNADMMKTDSYSSELVRYSRFYKTFGQVLSVRTIKAEYLVAMKLRSGRIYKHDLSDAVGIIKEHLDMGEPIEKEDIIRAFQQLYGKDAQMSEVSAALLESVYSGRDLAELYENTEIGENFTRETLLRFEKNYPGVLNQENVEVIAEKMKKKKDLKGKE